MSAKPAGILVSALILISGCAGPRLLQRVLDEPLQTLPAAPVEALDSLVLEGSGTGWFASTLFDAADRPKQAFDALREPSLNEAPWEPWLRTLAATRLATRSPAVVGDPVVAPGAAGPWEDLRRAAAAELREVRGLGLARDQGAPGRGENTVLPLLRVAGPFPLEPSAGLDSTIGASRDAALGESYLLNGLSMPTYEVEQLGGVAEIASRGMGLYVVEGWFQVDRKGRALVSVESDNPIRLQLQQTEIFRVDRDRSFQGDRQNGWVELTPGRVRVRLTVASAAGQLRLGLRVTPASEGGAQLSSVSTHDAQRSARVALVKQPEPIRDLRETIAEALFGGLLPAGTAPPLWWYEFARATGDEEILHALATRDSAGDTPLHLWRRSEALATLPWFSDAERAHRSRSLLERASIGWTQDTRPETELAALLADDGRGRSARKRLSELPGLRNSPEALLVLAGLLRDEGDADAALRLLLDGLASVDAPCALAERILSWRDAEGPFAASARLPYPLQRCEVARAWRVDHEALPQGRFDEAYAEASDLAALRPGDIERARRLLRIASHTQNPGDREAAIRSIRRRIAEPAALASLLSAEAKNREQAIASLQASAAAAPTDVRRELAAYRLGLPSLTPELQTRSSRILAERAARTSEVDSGAIYLLDAMDVRVAEDGSALTLVHQIIELGSRDSLDELGEFNLPGEGELLLARSIKRDGTKLPVADTAGKDSLSFADLEVGDLIEVAYLLESRPFAPEVWAPTPRFMFRAPNAHFVESAVSFEFPATWEQGLIADARFAAPPTISRSEGRVRYAFVERNMEPYRADEPSAPEEEFVPSVAMARNFNMESWLLWRMRWQWFDQIAPARLLAQVTGGLPAARNEADLRTLFRWVNTSVLPADDWAQPTGFASLLRQRGDRTAALHLLLISRGLDVGEVALRSIAADPVARPVFDHSAWSYRALRVTLDGETYWLDPEDDDAVFNLLPRSVQGSVAIDQRAPDTTIAVPVAPRSSWQNRIRATLTLAADGSLRGELSESVPLSDAAAFRRFVHAVPDEQERLQRSERRLSRTFPAISLTELSIDGLPDLDAPLTIRYRFDARGFARQDGNHLLYEGALFARPLAQAYATSAERSSPLRAEAYLDETVRTSVTPPPGFRLVTPPAAADVNCEGMSFRRSVKTEGTELVIEHTITAPYRYVAPADYPAFAVCAARIEEAQRFTLDWVR